MSASADLVPEPLSAPKQSGPEHTKLSRTGRIVWRQSLVQAQDTDTTDGTSDTDGTDELPDSRGTGERWEKTWFRMSAGRKKQQDPVDAFWQRIGSACITALCHISSLDNSREENFERIPELPLPEEASDWIDAAPPMPGGEFLDPAMLGTLWKALLTYCRDECQKAGSISAFLGTQATRWQNIGRIIFHLAENRMNETAPFAFLATYTVGLNERGEPRHLPLSTAVNRYSGDREKLLHLLDPLLRASKDLEWVNSMLVNRTIYQPRPWTPKEAYRLLQSAETLERDGVGLRVPNWWKKRSRPQVQATLNTRTGSRLGADALINVDITVAVGDQQLSPEEIQEILDADEDGLVLVKGQWIEIDRAKLQQALDFWHTAELEASRGDLTFAQGLRLLAGLPRDGGTDDEDEEIREWSFAAPGNGFRELLDSARTTSTGPVPDLHATLRPYQETGVGWLSFMGQIGLGCCLADDMGLGKTIQILALLLKERDGRANLLIAPASLLRNWLAEARRFAPSLRTMLLHGMNRQELEALSRAQDAFSGTDLVLVSYAGCTRLPWLARYPWKRVIADEAQAIKNARTKQSRSVRAITNGAHIALTGTPIENSLNDLWALFDFLNPGLLGTTRQFNDLIKTLSASTSRFAPLRKLTRPYILRRMKTDRNVIDSLPDKTEMPLSCYLTKKQAGIYMSVTKKLEQTLQSMKDAVDDADAQAKRRIIILQSLMLLKQVCNHPTQATGNGTYDVNESGKFLALQELCRTIAERQEKVLVFTQFREITQPLASCLTEIFQQEGLVLHGDVPVKKRQAIVDRFQRYDGPPFLVLTLKVGGTGLTLTEANHVIHFDRWWNPAVEDQATDRAFRIGQKRNVLVHKCITRGTLEERIDQILTDKRELADEVLGSGSEISLTSLSDAEICELISLDATQIGG